MQHIYVNTGYFVYNDPHELIKKNTKLTFSLKNNHQNKKVGDVEKSLTWSEYIKGE